MSDEGNEAEANPANVQLCGATKIPDEINPTQELETHQQEVPGITVSQAVVYGSEMKVGEVRHLEGTQGSEGLQGGNLTAVGKIVSTDLQDHGCPETPEGGDNVGTLRDYYNRGDESAAVMSSDDEELDLIVDIDQQTSAVQGDDRHRQSDQIQFGSFEPASSLPSSSAVITQPMQSRFASTSLYIADLNVNASESYLVEMFSLVGEVEVVRIYHDANTGRPMGRGYVKFRTVEQAANALANLNYTRINGEPMRLMFSMFNNPARTWNEKANIFIKNLDASIDTQALHETFSAFGFVLSCKVAVNERGLSKGHGFVQFEEEESARIAIEKVNGMLMENRIVSVLPFAPRIPQMVQAGADHHEFTNVYVKDFSINVTDEDLKAVFSKFGGIKSAVVMRDAQGVSKCFGFVDFQDHKAAAEAILTLDGKVNVIDGRQWYVGRAQKREERIKLVMASMLQDHQEPQLETQEQETMRLGALMEETHRNWWNQGYLSSNNNNHNNYNIIINSDHVNSGDVSKKKRRRRGKRGGRKSKCSQEDQTDKLPPPVALMKVHDVAAPSQSVASINDPQHVEGAPANSSPSQLSPQGAGGCSAHPSHPHELDDAILTSALVSAVSADERLAMLGGCLYPLLEQFEQAHSTEVALYVLVRVETNEIDQLTASPEALQGKIDSSKKLVMVVPQLGAQEGPAQDVIAVPGLMSLQMMA